MVKALNFHSVIEIGFFFSRSMTQSGIQEKISYHDSLAVSNVTACSRYNENCLSCYLASEINYTVHVAVGKRDKANVTDCFKSLIVHLWLVKLTLRGLATRT